MNLTISERFFTLSGEAPAPGIPIYLIRFSGCNLDCTYCDTPHKNEITETLSESALADEIAHARTEWPNASILFTGGEPLYGKRQNVIAQIIRKFPDTEFFIETNGSVIIDEQSPDNARYVADWKTASSGCGGSFAEENLHRLRAGKDCIKMVVAREDLPETLQAVSAIKKENRKLDVYLSPQSGKIGFDELADFIVANRLPVSLSLQLHKIIWGNRRGV